MEVKIKKTKGDTQAIIDDLKRFPPLRICGITVIEEKDSEITLGFTVEEEHFEADILAALGDLIIK